MERESEVLRRAAALMRERAEEATPGPWQVDVTDGADYVFDVATGGFCFVPDHNCLRPVENAAHIASWHPAVALAVADWLDAEARYDDSMGDGHDRCFVADCRIHRALAVARAYLGSDA